MVAHVVHFEADDEGTEAAETTLDVEQEVVCFEQEEHRTRHLSQQLGDQSKVSPNQCVSGYLTQE